MLIALGYVDCSSTELAIVLLVLAVSLTGFQYSGFIVNHVDIAPYYAGILFGISNSLASISGFVSPVIVGEITKEVFYKLFLKNTVVKYLLKRSNTENQYILPIKFKND